MDNNLNECDYKHYFEFNNIGQMNKYPDNDGVEHNDLLKNISHHISVDIPNITITSGADDAIILCISTLFKNKVGKIYKYGPSYKKIEELNYEIINVETPLNNKYKSMEFYEPDNSIIYICNPCNPTGDIWEEHDYLLLCKKYPTCNIIIDEAYIEFVDINTKCSNVNKYDNLYYIRTFSKLFGLAGMRLGYLVHNREFNHNYSFKNVLTISKLCGVKVLENKPFYKNISELVNKNKLQLNCTSGGNFIFIRVKYDMLKMAKKELTKNNIIARYGYGNGIRITIHPYMNNLQFLFNFIKKYNTIDIRTLYTDIDLRINLLKLFKLFIKTFTYEWWADAGTRLGAERHSSIIPWDNDIDIGIMDIPDYSKFEKQLSNVFNLQRNRTDKYYQICNKSFVGHPNQTIHIDIFPHIIINDRIVNNDDRFREYNCGEVNLTYGKDELFPLRHVKFYDFTIPVPNCKLPDTYKKIEIHDDNNELIYVSNTIY
jgi:histidinol-phosphate aminotransferase